MWKGKTFVFQGQFNGTDGKPMDAMALTRLIRKHGGEVQACVPKKENARRGIMILLVTTIAEVKKHGRNGKSNNCSDNFDVFLWGGRHILGGTFGKHKF